MTADERIAAALALHVPCHENGDKRSGSCRFYRGGGLHFGTPYCTTCRDDDGDLVTYPCPTVRALTATPQET